MNGNSTFIVVQDQINMTFKMNNNVNIYISIYIVLILKLILLLLSMLILIENIHVNNNEMIGKGGKVIGDSYHFFLGKW